MTVETIVRTIVTAVAMLNAILVMLGKAPLDLDENTLYVVASGIAALASTAWSWWKNNDVTSEAKAGSRLMRDLKRNRGSDGDGLHEF